MFIYICIFYVFVHDFIIYVYCVFSVFMFIAYVYVYVYACVLCV